MLFRDLAKQGMSLGTQARQTALNQGREQKMRYLSLGGQRPSLSQGYLNQANFDPTKEVDLFPLLYSIEKTWGK
jgi:hypothetical protein